MIRAMCSLAFLTLMAVQAHAAITLSVGDFSIVEGTASVEIPVFISGDATADLFDSATLAFSVGDGGSILGGSDAVPITGFTFDQSVFDTNVTPGAISTIWTGTPAVAFGTSASLVEFSPPDPLPGDPAATANPNGIFATVFIDTSGLVAGESFALSANPNDFSDFSVGGTAIPFTATGGSLSVTAVPEPGSIAFIGLVAGSLLARRRNRKQNSVDAN